MMTLLNQTLLSELSMQKPTKKPIIDDTTICRNKSTTKNATTSRRQNTLQQVDDKNTKKQRQTQIGVEKTILLEKKTHIWGRNDEISDFRLRIVKKLHLVCNQEGLERENRGKDD